MDARVALAFEGVYLFWSEIGFQIALLKRLGGLLSDVYIGVLEKRVRLAVVLRYTTGEVDPAQWDQYQKFVSSTLGPLEALVPRYKLPDPPSMQLWVHSMHQ